MGFQQPVISNTGIETNSAEVINDIIADLFSFIHSIVYAKTCFDREIKIMLPVADSSRPRTVTEYIDRPIAYNNCYSATGLIDNGNSAVTNCCVQVELCSLYKQGVYPILSSPSFFQMTDSCVCLVTG